MLEKYFRFHPRLMLHFRLWHFSPGQLKPPAHAGGSIELGWLQLAAELSTGATRSGALGCARCPDQMLCRGFAGDSEFIDE